MLRACAANADLLCCLSTRGCHAGSVDFVHVAHHLNATPCELKIKQCNMWLKKKCIVKKRVVYIKINIKIKYSPTTNI